MKKTPAALIRLLALLTVDFVDGAVTSTIDYKNPTKGGSNT
ncbi:MAG: hypothetical protein ABSF77_10640 [Spirochaetia bacterium]